MMVTFHGWKRFELNDVMKFHEVSETTFHSIMRRSLVINRKGRFVSAERLAQLPPGVQGYFLMQEDMKDFVTSQKYADGGGDGGLSRATTRSACGLLVEEVAPLTPGPLAGPSHVSRHAPVGAVRVAAHGVAAHGFQTHSTRSAECTRGPDATYPCCRTVSTTGKTHARSPS